MGSRRWIVLLACAAALGAAIAGCAKPGTGVPVGGDVTSSSPSAGPSGVTPPGQTPTGLTPTGLTPTAGIPPTGKGLSTTLRGETVEGVEAGCVLLHTDDGKDYLLLYGDRDLIRQGGRLEVTGEIRNDLVTTCQQGVPFVVTSTRRI